MAKFIVGLIVILAGSFMTIKSESMMQSFGAMDWAEKYGGSRFMYKVIGVIIIFVGFLIMFDLHEKILLWIFGPLFGL